ncbi:hypothetical protein [Methanopyrus kandleri]|uniref:Uncharacterized protein n=1 Tax=Methanopyrus kandleri TaxID=2320 RepID=A0A832TC49_9EURY|nr:hypothetical protein [Methanopyrus kandleri]HII70103.1 hypothetical protein [Methanopyrus kandleri]
MSSGSSKVDTPVVELRGKSRAVSREVLLALEELEELNVKVVSAGVDLGEEDRPTFYAARFLDLPELEVDRRTAVRLLQGEEIPVDARPGHYRVIVGNVVLGVGKVGRDGKLRCRAPRKYARLRLW